MIYLFRGSHEVGGILPPLETLKKWALSAEYKNQYIMQFLNADSGVKSDDGKKNVFHF